MFVNTDRDHLALGGHVRGPVAEPQLGLQRVEVGLQLGLLLDAGWLVLTSVTDNMIIYMSLSNGYSQN